MNLNLTCRITNYLFPVSAAVAAVGIVLIILTMTTNLAAHLLPMSDDYLQIMIPTAPDGGEPLSLTALTPDINDKTISVSGTVMNRTDRPLSDVIAVVQLLDTTGRFPQTQEVPLMPPELQPQQTGTFMAMATLQEKPGGILLKFRLADGPFISHKDERSQ